MSNTTLIKTIPPSTLHPTLTKLHPVFLALGASWMIAALAQVSIFLPFTPVPITGQSFAVLLCGALLGSRKGALAVALYLAQGGLGLPFFAGGGSGFLRLFGPTGGYLIGYVAAAYISGRILEHTRKRDLRSVVLAFGAAQICIYAAGMTWLGILTGFHQIWLKGFLPFMPGMLIKTSLAGALVIKKTRTTA